MSLELPYDQPHLDRFMSNDKYLIEAQLASHNKTIVGLQF